MESVVALAGLGDSVRQFCQTECILSVQTMDAMDLTMQLRLAFPDDGELNKLRLARFVLGVAFEHGHADILDLCEILSDAGVDCIEALPTKIDTLENCPRGYKAIIKMKFRSFVTPPTGPRSATTLSSDDPETEDEQIARPVAPAVPLFLAPEYLSAGLLGEQHDASSVLQLLAAAADVKRDTVAVKIPDSYDIRCFSSDGEEKVVIELTVTALRKSGGGNLLEQLNYVEGKMPYTEIQAGLGDGEISVDINAKPLGCVQALLFESIARYLADSVEQRPPPPGLLDSDHRVLLLDGSVTAAPATILLPKDAPAVIVAAGPSHGDLTGLVDALKKVGMRVYISSSEHPLSVDFVASVDAVYFHQSSYCAFGESHAAAVASTFVYPDPKIIMKFGVGPHITTPDDENQLVVPLKRHFDGAAGHFRVAVVGRKILRAEIVITSTREPPGERNFDLLLREPTLKVLFDVSAKTALLPCPVAVENLTSAWLAQGSDVANERAAEGCNLLLEKTRLSVKDFCKAVSRLKSTTKNSAQAVKISHGSFDQLTKSKNLPVGGRVLYAASRLAACASLRVGNPLIDYEINRLDGFDASWTRLMKQISSSPTKRKKTRKRSHS